MGRKRKPEKSEEEIRRKIKKLEYQLAKAANKSACTSSEENITSMPLDSPYSVSAYCESPLLDTFRCDDMVPHPLSPHQTSPCTRISPRPASPNQASPSVPQQPALSPQPQPGTSADSGRTACTDELELDEDILQLLGDAPKADICLGPSIHKDVARRWQDILANGLPKDVKENLLKEYLIPSNCDLLLAPALNPEVKAALYDALVKRDSSLVYKQKQLGIALSALATVTDMVISNETSKQKILKPLSDACRILCDSHHAETRTRRGFVISSINTKLKDALIESKRDSFLFGDNVSEKLKAAKTIQQSGDALKNAQKPKFQRANTVQPTNKNINKGRLNYVPQHRKTDNKANDSRRTSNYAQRQSTSNTVRRPPDRTQPSKTTAAQRK